MNLAGCILGKDIQCVCCWMVLYDLMKNLFAIHSFWKFDVLHFWCLLPHHHNQPPLLSVSSTLLRKWHHMECVSQQIFDGCRWTYHTLNWTHFSSTAAETLTTAIISSQNHIVLCFLCVHFHNTTKYVSCRLLHISIHVINVFYTVLLYVVLSMLFYTCWAGNCVYCKNRKHKNKNKNANCSG